MAFIILFLTISAFFFYLSYQSLPNYSKKLFSSDIESQVIIKTDLHAVPHITGNKNEETFFGLGYVHAQERLWQMTYLKRLSQGRLSELMGLKCTFGLIYEISRSTNTSNTNISKLA